MTDATAPGFLVVSLSRNTAGLIAARLAALPRAARAHEHETIVVDNAFTWRSRRRLRQ